MIALPMPHRPMTHQARVDPRRIVEPVGALHAEESEQPVEPALLAVEHASPGEEGRHERDDVGHEEQCLEDARAAKVLAVHQHGHGEWQHQADGQCDEGEAQGHPERLPRARVFQQRRVVFEPDEADRGLLVQAQVEEREDQGGDDRDQGQEQEPDDPGADEQVAPQRFALSQGEAGGLLGGFATGQFDDAHACISRSDVGEGLGPDRRGRRPGPTMTYSARSKMPCSSSVKAAISASMSRSGVLRRSVSLAWMAANASW